MNKKGIYYYTTEEHLRKLEGQNYLDKQIALELLSNFTSYVADIDNFTRVPSSKLLEITREYKKYINFFIDNKMIFVDNQFEVGEKTMGYKLREENYSKAIKVEVENIKFQKQRITFFNSEKEKSKRQVKTEQFKKMKSYFKDFVGGINLQEAKEEIQQMEINARVSQFQLIDKIENGNFYFRRNKTNFRLDSNITNLKSNIKFFNKGNFTQIDISNSQPFFMGLVVSELYIVHNLYTNTSIDSVNQQLNLGCFCQKELKEVKKEEIEKFIDWTVGGKFYDNFIPAYIVDEDERKKERKKVKKMMMCVLFSKPESYKGQKKIFAYHFPGIQKWIDAFKKKNGYNQFAIMLQRTESKKVLDEICKELTEKDIYNVTIHDSWIVKNEQFDEALSIIKSHFVTTVPNFKFEKFNQTSTTGNECTYEYKEQVSKEEVIDEILSDKDIRFNFIEKFSVEEIRQFGGMSGLKNEFCSSRNDFMNGIYNYVISNYKGDLKQAIRNTIRN
jgi:hypothetical protein